MEFAALFLTCLSLRFSRIIFTSVAAIRRPRPASARIVDKIQILCRKSAWVCLFKSSHKANDLNSRI